MNLSLTAGSMTSTASLALKQLKFPPSLQSPEAFILEYSAFIERVQRGVESFHLPNYKEVLPALSQEQLHTLIGLTDSCRKTLEDYLSFVKEARANV